METINKKHICSLSGGKDSTAMLLLLIEKNYPLDEVVFLIQVGNLKQYMILYCG